MEKLKKGFVFFVFVFSFFHNVWSQTTQNINVIFTNEEGNTVADKAVYVALNYIKKTAKLGLSVDMKRVVGNRTDSQNILDALCAAYQQMLDGGTPPHLVFDTTRAGLASETVKSFTAALGLPTVTASYGQLGDLRQWRTIKPNEEEYLVQVSPPGDIIPEMVRTLVLNQNITNAAILFDDSFVMDHKYKALLQNVATRHLIDEINTDSNKIPEQLEDLVKLDLKNFFVLGSLDNIMMVLEAAEKKNLFNRKFAWHVLTKDSGELKASIKNATVLFAKPIVNNMYQDRLRDIGSTYQLSSVTPEIEAAFYFDLAIKSFLSVKEMLLDGAWKKNNVTNYVTCDDYEPKYSPKRFNLDLRSYLQKESSEPPTYGPFNININGLSYMEFSMALSAVYVRAGASDKSTQLGIWQGGFDNNLTLISAKDMKNYTADVVYKVVTVVVSKVQFVISSRGHWQKEEDILYWHQWFSTKLSLPQKFSSWCSYIKEDLNSQCFNCSTFVPASSRVGFLDIIKQMPFIYKDETAPKGFKGYCIDLIDEIANILHFDYEIEAVADGMFGNMDEKGNWNGIIKDLVDKKADIGLGSLSVMAERENVIDFTVPYYDLVGITILMKLPETPTSLFKFLTVLENEVWLCILAAYFFTSFLMWVFDRWSPYSYQNNREKYKDDEEKREFNLKECLWFCMTSLTPQGGGEAPKNLSGRLVAATWWLFGFIIIASYTANLAAFLTVSRLDTPIESLDDLSKQYKIQYAPVNGSSTMTYFQRMADIEARFYEIWKDMSLNDSLSDVERAKLAVWDYPVSDKYTKMWQAMKEATLPQTLEDAVERVKKSKSSSEGFAYLGDATDIKYLELANCEFTIVGEEFSRKPYAIAVQQGSPLKDQFNTAILQLLNRRELERLKERWWNKNPEKKQCDKADDQSDGISIQNIGGVFIVIFVGIGLACITLAFEYWWYKYRKNTKITNVTNDGSSQKHHKVAGFPKDGGYKSKEPEGGIALKINKLYPKVKF